LNCQKKKVLVLEEVEVVPLQTVKKLEPMELECPIH
jgi:hypothetical protein